MITIVLRHKRTHIFLHLPLTPLELDNTYSSINQICKETHACQPLKFLIKIFINYYKKYEFQNVVSVLVQLENSRYNIPIFAREISTPQI